MKLVTIP